MKSYNKSIFVAIAIVSFIFGAVQYNDPDAWLWMLIYGFMIGVAVLGSQKRLKKQSLIFIGILYLLWGVNLFPQEWEGVLLDEVGMKTLNIELGRESLGLFILSLFSFVMIPFVSPQKK